LRTGSTSSAPARARRLAMCSPTPSLAPVTRARRPSREGRSMSMRGMVLLLLLLGVESLGRPPACGARRSGSRTCHAVAPPIRRVGGWGRGGDVAIDRSGLGAFLRSRRSALQPEDVGLPRGARRRTDGLRREEIAALCHMSPDYYARL